MNLAEEIARDHVRAYVLVSQLPEDSRLMTGMLGGPVFGWTEAILANIDLTLNWLLYVQTKGMRKPKRNLPDYIKARIDEQEKQANPVSDLLYIDGDGDSDQAARIRASIEGAAVNGIN